MIIMLTLFLAVTCLGVGEMKEIGVHPVIVGGLPISVEDSPYIAAYFTKIINPSGDHLSRCGGSILTEQHVLSAAHCYYKRPDCLPTTTLEYVVVGADNPLKDGIVIGIEKTIIHPQYIVLSNVSALADTFENDVLVLKLVDKLQFNSRIQSIFMADRDQVIPNGAPLEVMGYGTKLTVNDNADLHKAIVPYIDLKTCQKIFPPGKITSSMLCAGINKFQSSTSGDSGGPLVYNNTLVGVVSFTVGPCTVPAMYARVSALRDFIDEAIASCDI